MSEKPGWGKTVMGWFVVADDDPGRPSAPNMPASGDDVDRLIAKYSGDGLNAGAGRGADASAAATSPGQAAGPNPALAASFDAGGAIDFAAVFEAAGVDSEERDRVTKAQDLLRSLPHETPTAVKKQIVEAALKAFGVPTSKIIEAAVEEVQGLEAFIHAGQHEVQRILSTGSERIAALELEIREIKQVMEQAIASQEGRARAANAEKLKVQDVLEFFGQEAVARVVEESPKLVSPRKDE